MDLAKLKALIDLVSQCGISELEITEGADFVRIRKALAPSAPVPTISRPQPHTAIASGTASRHAQSLDFADDGTRDHVVKVPLYGVFLRTPSPGAAPFVDLGQEIERGQQLCIIEAMKSFHAVTSEAAGILKAIHAEHGQEVESGQPLFQITLQSQQT